MKNNISTVFLDVDGTLLDFDEASGWASERC